MEDDIRRLIKCGFTEKNAIDVCDKFYREHDFHNLERYIRFAEIVFGNERDLKEGK